MDNAVKKAKEILRKSEEAVEEARKLVFSLELIEVWPDIFDNGGVTLIKVEKGALVFRSDNGRETVRNLRKAPASLLTLNASKLKPFNPIRIQATNELFRRRAEKRKQEKS